MACISASMLCQSGGSLPPHMPLAVAFATLLLAVSLAHLPQSHATFPYRCHRRRLPIHRISCRMLPQFGCHRMREVLPHPGLASCPGIFVARGDLFDFEPGEYYA